MNKALVGQLYENEVIEAFATVTPLGLIVGLPVVRALRQLRRKPIPYLVISNERVLIINIAGKFPPRELDAVVPADIVEQRLRRAGESYEFPSSAREFQEPGRIMSVWAVVEITVNDSTFFTQRGWNFSYHVER